MLCGIANDLLDQTELVKLFTIRARVFFTFAFPG
jgi:hypothetical protein